MKVHTQNERYSAGAVLKPIHISHIHALQEQRLKKARAAPRLRADRKRGRFRTGTADAHSKPVSLQNQPGKVSLLHS